MLNLERRHLVLLAVAGCLFLVGGYFSDAKIPFPDGGDKETVAPIEVDSEHVLMLYEANDAAHPVLESARKAGQVRVWMDEHNVVYRFYDVTDPPPHDAPKWVVDAYQLHDGSVPWLLIANKDSGYTGPLPKDVAGMIELLEQNQ